MMVLSKDALHVVESSNNRPDGTKFLEPSERHLEGGERRNGEDQNRSIPNRNSSATVIKPEISSEPRHPSRFEKKKNMRCPL